ncbi:MAG: Rrf2 family transcriptional regulator [Chthoniobacteraceae bacterium]
MRISKKAEYALRALVAMARHPKSWAIHELSEQERIPVKFLEQILLSLRRAGLLASKRGVGGGYALLKGPTDISLAEVVQILDGPLAPVPCAAERPTERCTCPDPRTCPIRIVMSGFREEMAGWLANRTVDDLLRVSPGADSLAFEI